MFHSILFSTQFSTDDSLINDNNNNNNNITQKLNQIDIERGESFNVDNNNKTALSQQSIYNHKINGIVQITSTNELNNSDFVNNNKNQHNNIVHSDNTPTSFVSNGSTKNSSSNSSDINTQSRSYGKSLLQTNPQQSIPSPTTTTTPSTNKYENYFTTTDTNNANTTTNTAATLPIPPPTVVTANTATVIDGCTTVLSTDNETNKKTSNSTAVSFLRRSKTIGIVVISSVLAVSIVILLCTTMGWDYTIPAIVVGAVVIVASSGLWHWIYVAILTAPRDIR